MQTCQTALVALGGVLTAALMGCDDPAHANRIQMRCDNMAHTVEVIDGIEARRPQNFRNTVQLARETIRKDVYRTQENPGIIARGIQAECDRFRDRQPVYRREIENQLRGDPENIRRTLPYVIW
jgi:hypothetical protein